MRRRSFLSSVASVSVFPAVGKIGGSEGEWSMRSRWSEGAGKGDMTIFKNGNEYSHDSYSNYNEWNKVVRINADEIIDVDYISSVDNFNLLSIRASSSNWMTEWGKDGEYIEYKRPEMGPNGTHVYMEYSSSESEWYDKRIVDDYNDLPEPPSALPSVNINGLNVYDRGNDSKLGRSVYCNTKSGYQVHIHTAGTHSLNSTYFVIVYETTDEVVDFTAEYTSEIEDELEERGVI